MKQLIWMVLLAVTVSVSAQAQLSAITGDWKTVDDKTGENFSIITIYKGSDGLFYGKIAKMLVGPADMVCEACE